MTCSETHGFAASVAARELLGRLARTLGGAGIDVMPLKGVLLQLTIYEDPATRPIADLDALVPEARFDEALALLIADGLTPRRTRADFARPLHDRRLGFTVDLHRRLFSRGRYRLATAGVFARARRDPALLGGAVLRMDPLDLYAHLVGKAASDAITSDHRQRLEDLRRVRHHHELRAAPVAAHLSRHGLARAARYAMPLLARSDPGDPFPYDVVDALPPDVVGDALVVLARNLRTRGVGLLLDRSLPAAIVSAAHAARGSRG